MLLQSLRRSLFHVSLFTFCLSLIAPSAANAIAITRSLNWTGDGGSTLSGTFTGEDTNGDGIIRADTSGSNEFTVLDVTLTEFNTSTSITYTLTELLGFTLNFNYDTTTGIILQSLDSFELLQGISPNFTAGLSIGDNTSGLALESLSSGPILQFNDNLTGFSNSDNSNTFLNATPVPFEFEGSAGILTLGAIWGFRQWRKNRIKK